MLMITTDGRTLSYDVSGAGAPIVFVAGLGERGTYWMAQVAAFSSAFQVVTFDHRGVGASEGEPPYKVEQWAADTLRLIDCLGLDRVHLVGHSTGGIIAQVLAADHSDRVASLVLGATWARLDARLRKLFVFRKRTLYEQVDFDRRSAGRNTPQEIAAARIDALLAHDAGERLRSIRNPTLLIAAADDLLVSWQLSELIAPGDCTCASRQARPRRSSVSADTGRSLQRITARVLPHPFRERRKKTHVLSDRTREIIRS
jgi:aminoacrylate hydrolase